VSEIRRFYVAGDAKIFDVGLRPALLGEGSEYSLRIACENQRDKKRVEVVVSGKLKDIEEFHSHIAGHDIRLFPEDKMYEVTPLQEYNGPIPDWDYYLHTLTAAQIHKGFLYIGQILRDLPREFAKALKGQ
jgi:acylphosphatase